LIHIAPGALDLLERLDQSSDIQRWTWSPPPELTLNPYVRQARRVAGSPKRLRGDTLV